MHGKCQLLQIIPALSATSRFASHLHGRQQERNEQRDNATTTSSCIRVKPFRAFSAARRTIIRRSVSSNEIESRRL
jgi:hypothetical protein